MYCKFCGNEILDDSRFCEYCGHCTYEERTRKNKKIKRFILITLSSVLALAILAVGSFFFITSQLRRHNSWDMVTKYKADSDYGIADCIYERKGIQDGSFEKCFYFSDKTYVYKNANFFEQAGLYSVGEKGLLRLFEYDENYHEYRFENAFFYKSSDLVSGIIPKKNRFNTSAYDSSGRKIVFSKDGTVCVDGNAGTYLRNGYEINITLDAGSCIFLCVIDGYLYDEVYQEIDFPAREIYLTMEYMDTLYQMNQTGLISNAKKILIYRYEKEFIDRVNEYNMRTYYGKQ